MCAGPWSLALLLFSVLFVLDEMSVNALEGESFLRVSAPASEHHVIDGVGTTGRLLKQDAFFDESNRL